MRTIPSSVAQLLKSKVMIGSNAPTVNVTIAGTTISNSQSNYGGGTIISGTTLTSAGACLQEHWFDIKGNATWYCASVNTQVPPPSTGQYGYDPTKHYLYATNEPFNSPNYPSFWYFSTSPLQFSWGSTGYLLVTALPSPLDGSVGSIVTSGGDSTQTPGTVFSSPFQSHVGGAAQLTEYLMLMNNPNNSTEVTQQTGSYPACSIIPSAVPISSISIHRDKTAAAASATIVMDNRAGWASPDNQSGTFYQKTYPGSGIKISLGYGTNQIQSFYGYIDKVSESSMPQQLSLQCRDNMRTALDQTIYYNGKYQKTYTNVSPEYIFEDLAIHHAGLGSGMVGFDKTGMTIDTKTFTWQTIADAFTWLQDLTGFEVWSDEYGNYWFKNPQDGLPVKTPVYSYQEGTDIVQIGLDIDDGSQYRYVVGIGSTGTGTNKKSIVVSWTNPQADNLHLPAHKTLKVEFQDSMTQADMQKAVNNIGLQMVAKIRKVQWVVPGNPWLQIGDSVNIKETSTQLNAIYRILEISHGLSPSQGFLTTFVAYKYQ